MVGIYPLQRGLTKLREAAPAGKPGKAQALEGVFSKGFCGLKAILGTLRVQAQSSDAG